MKALTIIKLTGLAILTMITLVIISILEVSIYSYLIYPGQNPQVYEAHAEASAPFISGIFGFLVFYLIARFWKKKRTPDLLKRILLFPLIYVLLDIIIITSAGVAWSEFFIIFVLANAAKFLGSYLGYKLT